MLALVLALAAVATAVAVLAGAPQARLLAVTSGLAAAAALVLTSIGSDEPASVLASAGACLLFGLAVSRREHEAAPSSHELERHLARCRRRSEQASALVVVLSDETPPKDAAQALRMTDSAQISRVGRRWELHALLDGPSVERHAVQQRFNEFLSAPAFGWATFPADGLTLEALFERARESITQAGSTTVTRQAAASAPTSDDPAAA